MTFGPGDVDQLDSLLLQRAHAVISLREVVAGNHQPTAIALRHDVDDNEASFQTAQTMARWEKERGYRSTYYVLHTASYWNGEPFFRAGLEEIALAGHEIGIHVNAIAHALETGGNANEILDAALEELRGWGHAVTGAASHGDRLCGVAGFINYDQFTECARPDVDAHRQLAHRGRSLTLEPMPLDAFGLAYEAYHIPRGPYLTDSGGSWFPRRFEDFALHHDFTQQLQILQHPDWWGAALSPDREAAAA